MALSAYDSSLTLAVRILLRCRKMRCGGSAAVLYKINTSVAFMQRNPNGKGNKNGRNNNT